MREQLRLQAVKQFEQLSLKSDHDLQYTVALAAELCQTSIAFVSIIDDQTEWIKVSRGTEIEELPLAYSFCQYTMKSNRLFIVKDTLKDARFRHYPNVTSGPKIRFYASFPLITMEGFRIGTLCVVDTKAHSLSNKQKSTLKLLSKHATSIMELKLSLAQLDQSFVDIKLVRESKIDNEIKLRSMFESLTDSYYLLGKNGEMIDFNRTAYNFVHTMFGAKLTYGAMMNDYLTKAYADTFAFHYQNALLGQKVQIERQADYGIKGKIWWECIFEPVRNDMSEIIGVSYVARNIDGRKLQEEKILAQNRSLAKIGEIQAHDYRAPLATILGLLHLIEIEDYKATKDYVIMLQAAAGQLDRKITEVINIVNNEIEIDLDILAAK
jgi:PAS domain S-box-containing protein